MRISLLLQREPFGEILEKTLSHFFNSLFQQEFSVKWEVAPGLGRAIRTKDAWICNPYLNALFSRNTQKLNFEPILREFSYSPTPWKRPLQQIYCSLATQELTAGLLGNYRLQISPPLPRADRLLIVGGNHRIRVLDRERNLCYVIGKHGFETSRTKEEVRFRTSNTNVPVPKILEVAEDTSWYAESYIVGTPVNRIADLAAADKALSKADAHIRKLAGSTLERQSLSSYCLSLQERIEKRVTSSSLLNTAQKKGLGQQLARLITLLAPNEYTKDSLLSTSQTHGDYQSGNILVNGGDTWIIDWEYTRRRQSGYDALVYQLRSRFGNFFLAELQKATNGIENSVLANWPGLNWQESQQRKKALALFLLEELDLYLEENDNRLFSQASVGLSRFVENIEQYIDILERELVGDVR